MITVVVADDHALVREGICSILERAANIEVIGQAGDGKQAIAMVQSLAPDILIADIAMPHMDGLQTAAEVRDRFSQTQVVILSVHDDPPIVRQALRSGARGYVLKRSMPEELALAVRAAARRQTYLSPAISANIVEEFLNHTDETDAVAVNLTRRERQVLQLLVEGGTNKAIALQLCISDRTVEKHRANIRRKLDVRDNSSLIKEAIRLKLAFVE
ncbi:MAG: response regulator [Methyloligellaceae bacterium]